MYKMLIIFKLILNKIAVFLNTKINRSIKIFKMLIFLYLHKLNLKNDLHLSFKSDKTAFLIFKKCLPKHGHNNKKMY